MHTLSWTPNVACSSSWGSKLVQRVATKFTTIITIFDRQEIVESTFEFAGVRFFLMPYFAPLICPRCISPSKQFTPHPLSPRNIVCTVFPWYPNQVNITIFDVSETKRGRRTMSLREISPKRGCLAALLQGLGHEKKNRSLPPPFFLVTPLVGVSVLRFFLSTKNSSERCGRARRHQNRWEY